MSEVDYKILTVLRSGDKLFRAYIGGTIDGYYVLGSAQDTYHESWKIGYAHQRKRLKAVDRGSRN